MQRTRRISSAATALLLAFVAFTKPSAATAATLKVTVKGDPGLASNHRCSVREAIAAVNAPGVRTPCGRAGRSSNTIVLRAGRYSLVGPALGHRRQQLRGPQHHARAQPDHRRCRQRVDRDRCVRTRRSGAVDRERGEGHLDRAGDSRRPCGEWDRGGTRGRRRGLCARCRRDRLGPAEAESSTRER